MRALPLGRIELWGGHECTVNRVHDGYRDQTRLSGHQHRPEDLELFAGLGLSRLRYPVLWERVAPKAPGLYDWRWSDDRLARIGRLGMAPIVGLLHHGSGPTYTNLLADDFPVLFGRYAGAVAARYPHVRDWTPVNEPLTTARFSALYGHWHPHARDEGLFWRALLNQIDGTRAAMRAIRAVNPAAQLIQTEDLGRCHATAALAGVAEHLNDRRWMTWDLLAGHVRPGHALWHHLSRYGLGDRLRAIADDPCPADMLGVNHYVTSDRFLDDRAEAHAGPLPPEGYHDVTAARVLASPPPGLPGVLREAWARYGTPLAVTECQLGCTREEQVRWLAQGWRDCHALAAEGVDVRALTAWSLLGSTDWDSLLTRTTGSYDPGAFDVRGGAPRETALAGLLRSLADLALPTPGILASLSGKGWWQRDAARLEYPPYPRPLPAAKTSVAAEGPPLLVAGAAGEVRDTFAHICAMRGLRLRLVQATPDLATLDRQRPWAVIDAGALAGLRPDDELARDCAKGGIPYARFADDAAGADVAVLVLVVDQVLRTEGPEGLVAAIEAALRDGRPLRTRDAEPIRPVYLPDAVQACLDLVIDGAIGCHALHHGEALTPHAFAHRLADALGFEPAPIAALPFRAQHPRDEIEPSLLPPLDDALARYAAIRKPLLAAASGGTRHPAEPADAG